MVFTEIDKNTMRILCTLVKLSRDTDADQEDIIKVGQHLGVPKDDTRELFDEIEEYDIMSLVSEEEKQKFIKNCFSYLDQGFNPTKSELRLYNQVVNYLGVGVGSNN